MGRHPTEIARDLTVPALEVRGLTLTIQTGRGQPREVLSNVGFSVMPGQALGLVGESGSGKSMTSLAIMGLAPTNARVVAGEVLLAGEDLLRIPRSKLRRVRGSRICMVFQDPVTSLDPSYTVGEQLAEGLRIHKGLRGADLERESIALLKKVHIPSASERLAQYPHELSGGMRQRVCSAVALSGDPDVLIADEPTTALDVTTQAQYLAMLRELQETTGFALVLISHDLSIIRQMCESMAVMYAGQVVESGPVREIIESKQHPYTAALFDALPSLDPDAQLQGIKGKAPDPSEYAEGCRFAPRCGHTRVQCVNAAPELVRRGPDRSARCFGTEPDGWIRT